ncbi:MAG: hypothetical protein LUD72_06680 [Bacteroidales bacterium]|nr:hypothetical protein [Bacteroidales bacterium]
MMDTDTPIAIVSHDEYTRLLNIEAYMGVLKDYVESLEQKREEGGGYPVVDFKYIKAIADKCPVSPRYTGVSNKRDSEDKKEEKE